MTDPIFLIPIIRKSLLSGLMIQSHLLVWSQPSDILQIAEKAREFILAAQDDPNPDKLLAACRAIVDLEKIVIC